MFNILSTCKGGGYRYARTQPPHPRANSKGLYPLHRVLAENKLGRLLERREHVHHIDGNPANNDPANLEVLSIEEHAREHAKHIDPVELACPVCERTFQLKPHQHRLRASRKETPVCCSRSCGAIQAQRYQ